MEFSHKRGFAELRVKITSFVNAANRQAIIWKVSKVVSLKLTIVSDCGVEGN